MFARWNEYVAIPLRLVVGGIFVVHGAQKLMGLPEAVKFVSSLGLAPGVPWAVVAGVVELAGGVALLMGFLTRWVALALAVEMVAALALVYAPLGRLAAQAPIELRLTLIAGLLALAGTGAQKWSLDERAVLRTVSPPGEVKQAA